MVVLRLNNVANCVVVVRDGGAACIGLGVSFPSLSRPEWRARAMPAWWRGLSSRSGTRSAADDMQGPRTCEGGSLPLNPFGEALKQSKFFWTAELCCADSDGDGQTNGKELGDPAWDLAGVWDPDSLLTNALLYHDASHPGFASVT